MVEEDPHNDELQAEGDPAGVAPEQGGDQIQVEILDGTVPPKTWATLMEEAALPEVSYAHQLHQDNKEVNWELMLMPFTKIALAMDDQNYDPEVAMWQFADAPGNHMFMAVKQSRFEVMYGMRRCTPVHQLGERITWLMGDAG
jgi:hypothetical protein